MKTRPSKRADTARRGIHRMIVETDRKHREAIDTHKKILVAAEAREAEIMKEIDEVRWTVLVDKEKSERYMKLLQERGRVQRTIESARRTLQGS
jgi:hypothetical protein